MPSSRLVLAGVPVLNEEQAVGNVVLGARQYVNEVIVVDDGSTDQTAQVAALAGATVITHPTIKGYVATVQSIFFEARKRQPDVLVLLDGDSIRDCSNIPSI